MTAARARPRGVLYLDSSALVKLVVAEPGPPARDCWGFRSRRRRSEIRPLPCTRADFPYHVPAAGRAAAEITRHGGTNPRCLRRERALRAARARSDRAPDPRHAVRPAVQRL